MGERAEIRIGTMGFSYREWTGPFYPPGTRAEDYLARYAEVFDTVEMDTTFYGPPQPRAVRGWAQATPKGFLFTAKLPRAITHEKLLVDVAEDLALFLRSVEPLGDKLGACLIQLPPTFGTELRPSVEAFLALLPRDFPFALEFRDRRWVTAETAELLARHQVCWAGLDLPGMPREVPVTSGFAYLRLLGDRRQVTVRDRVVVDREADLEGWRGTIEALCGRVRRVFSFVNNHYSGHSPATGNRLKELLGLPLRRPAAALQLDLFS